MVATPVGIKEHRKNCEKQSIKNINKNAIECQECGKVCPNFQALKVHSMFHQSSVTTNDASKQSAAKQDGKDVCDICGKVLADFRGLYAHKVRMHT
jgi:hypothetical protein